MSKVWVKSKREEYPQYPLLDPPRNKCLNGEKSVIRVFETSGIVTHDDGSLTIEKNLTNEYSGFYVSYSYYEPAYGGATTALVLGQMQRFYILEGDHSKQYEALVDKGFEACLEYYINSPDKMEKFSDMVPTILSGGI